MPSFTGGGQPGEILGVEPVLGGLGRGLGLLDGLILGGTGQFLGGCEGGVAGGVDDTKVEVLAGDDVAHAAGLGGLGKAERGGDFFRALQLNGGGSRVTRLAMAGGKNEQEGNQEGAGAELHRGIE
jgi:hypothetical protein